MEIKLKMIKCKYIYRIISLDFWSQYECILSFNSKTLTDGQLEHVLDSRMSICPRRYFESEIQRMVELPWHYKNTKQGMTLPLNKGLKSH